MRRHTDRLVVAVGGAMRRSGRSWRRPTSRVSRCRWSPSATSMPIRYSGGCCFVSLSAPASGRMEIVLPDDLRRVIVDNTVDGQVLARETLAVIPRRWKVT